MKKPAKKISKREWNAAASEWLADAKASELAGDIKTSSIRMDLYRMCLEHAEKAVA